MSHTIKRSNSRLYRRFPALYNDTKALSSNIQVITNLSSMSKTKVLIEDYSNLDSKGIFQSRFKSIRSKHRKQE